MVLKNGKGGVCSGNTLRLKNTKYRNRYARESFISVKQIKDQSTIEELDQATYLNSSNVNYSLNKKGRWILPDIIKEEIATSFQDIKPKVTLMELHKLLRKNNCIGFYTNKGKRKEVLPNKCKYLNRLSVVNVNEKPKRKRRNNRTRGGNNDEQIADDTESPVDHSEVSYNVVYPCSLECSATLSKPKFIDHDIKLKSDYRSKSSIKGGSRKKSSLQTEKLLEDVLCQHLSEIEDITDEEVPISPRSTFNITDYVSISSQKLYKRSKYKKPKRKSVKISEAVQRKNHIHYMDCANEEEIPEDYSNDAPTALVKSPISIPIAVILPNLETDPSHLMANFKDLVKFTNCKPYKFMLDITEDVVRSLKSSPLFKKIVINTLDLTTFLVFSYKYAYDDTHNVYNVQLNFPIKMDSCSIETIFEMMETSLEGVLQRSLMYIESIPEEYFYRKDFLSIKCSRVSAFPTLNDYAIMDVKSEYPDLKINTNNCDRDTDEFEWVSKTERSFCNICFEDISETSHISTTTLQECDHWFCDSCWREHLLSSLNSGMSKHTCPEYDCDQIIDTCSMIPLVNIRDIRRSEIRRISSAVDATKSQRWCPNTHCGRILESLENQKLIRTVASCDCGMHVCLLCGSQGHWPATCEQFKTYQNKLNAFGHDVLRDDYNEIPIITVRGKRCPGCNIFIEKHLGCPSMICVCGLGFCWSCLTPWTKHVNNGCYNKKDIEGTEKVHIRHIDKNVKGKPNETKLYLQAVENRKLRRRSHIKFLQGNANTLNKQMKWWIAKHQWCNWTSEQIEQLFKDLVDISIELNYIAEYCYVILDCENDRRYFLTKRIHFAASRLEVLSAHILDSIRYSKNMSGQTLLNRLSCLRENATNCVKSVVAVIRKYYNNMNKKV